MPPRRKAPRPPLVCVMARSQGGTTSEEGAEAAISHRPPPQNGGDLPRRGAGAGICGHRCPTNLHHPCSEGDARKRGGKGESDIDSRAKSTLLPPAVTESKARRVPPRRPGPALLFPAPPPAPKTPGAGPWPGSPAPVSNRGAIRGWIPVSMTRLDRTVALHGLRVACPTAGWVARCRSVRPPGANTTLCVAAVGTRPPQSQPQSGEAGFFYAGPAHCCC